MLCLFKAQKGTSQTAVVTVLQKLTAEDEKQVRVRAIRHRCVQQWICCTGVIFSYPQAVCVCVCKYEAMSAAS